MEEYERQKMSSSQRALQDLLENIIHDRKLNPRDKKKRLKQVREYPVYDHALNFNTVIANENGSQKRDVNLSWCDNNQNGPLEEVDRKSSSNVTTPTFSGVTQDEYLLKMLGNQ